MLLHGGNGGRGPGAAVYPCSLGLLPTMAEAAVEQLYSADDAEVLRALKLMGSLALDDPDAVVAAGGVATLCGLLSRGNPSDGVSAPAIARHNWGSRVTPLRGCLRLQDIVQEAAVALYLLLEEEDPDAKAAFVGARGRSRVTAMLERPGLPEEAGSWGLQILEMLPELTAEEIAAEAMSPTKQVEELAAEDLFDQQQAQAYRDQQQDDGFAAAEAAAERYEPPAVLPEYRVMRRCVGRRGIELDSKRAATVEAGAIVRPVVTCDDPGSFLRRYVYGEFRLKWPVFQ